jgi:hypothetical protein
MFLQFRRTRSGLRAALFFAVVFLGGTASAQLVSFTLAPGLSGTLEPTLSAGINLRNVLLLSGYGLDTRLLADVGGGSAVDLSALLKVPLSGLAENVDFYAGPGVVLSFGRPVRVRPSFTAGLTYDLGGPATLFGEGSYQFQGQFRTRVGILYTF